MTLEKISELMSNGINTFGLSDYLIYVPYQNLSEDSTIYDLIGPDPDAPYIIPYYYGSHLHNRRITIKEKTGLAKEYGFSYFKIIGLEYAPFPDNNLIPGIYPAGFSDGSIGSQVSPFSEAYWQRLTKMVVGNIWSVLI